MLTKDIRSMFNNGESPADCLRAAVASGMEYPDAEWRVINALNLDSESAEEMRQNYYECI
jgi:hypothetical protein